MRRFISLLLVIALATVGAYAWIVFKSQVLMTIKMDNTQTASVTMSAEKIGSYSGTISAPASYTLQPCQSTDGITYTDENGNPSNQYAQFGFYIKGDQFYNNLYVDNVTISPAATCVRVCVEYEGIAHVLNTSAFTKTCLNKPLDTKASFLKVRVWFDGPSVTQPITDDITVTLDLSASN